MDNETRKLFRETMTHHLRNFFAGKDNLAALARDMAVVSKQMVWNWKKEISVPSEMTAWKIVLAKGATQDTKKFAIRVLDIYNQFDWRDMEDDLITTLRNGTY